MELILEASLAWVIAWAMLLGALGGLAFGIAYPIESKSAGSAPGSAVRLPRRLPDGGFELAIAGPMAVGAVAAVASVFAVAVEEVDGRSTLSVGRLIWVGIVAGFGGTAVLEAMRNRLTAVVEARVDAVLDRLKAGVTDRVAEEVAARVPDWSEAAARAVELGAGVDVAAEVKEIVAAALERDPGARPPRKPPAAPAMLMFGSALLLAGLSTAAVTRADTAVSVADPGVPSAAPESEPPPSPSLEPTRSPSPSAPALRPDLTVKPTSSGFLVSNEGTAASDEFVVSSSTAGSSPVEQRLGPLEPGATTAETFLPCREGIWEVRADPQDAIDELDEQNNTAVVERGPC